MDWRNDSGQDIERKISDLEARCVRYEATMRAALWLQSAHLLSPKQILADTRRILAAALNHDPAFSREVKE